MTTTTTTRSLSPRTLALMDAAELVSQPPIISLEPTVSSLPTTRNLTAGSQSTTNHRTTTKRPRPSSNNEDQRQQQTHIRSAQNHHYHNNHSSRSRQHRSSSRNKGEEHPSSSSVPESTLVIPTTTTSTASHPPPPPPPKWKPYSTLTWEEKLQLEEYEKYKEIEIQKKLELRNKKRRAPVDSRGKVRPGVSLQDYAPPTPRNTTSKIIEEHQKYREQKHQQHQYRRSISKSNPKDDGNNNNGGDDQESIYSSSSSEVHSSDLEGIGDFFDRLEDNHDDEGLDNDTNIYDRTTREITRINSGTTASTNLSSLARSDTNTTTTGNFYRHHRPRRTRGTSFDDTMNLDPSSLLALGSYSISSNISNGADKVDNYSHTVVSPNNTKNTTTTIDADPVFSSSSVVDISRSNSTYKASYNSWDPTTLATCTVPDLVQLVLILRDFNKRLLDRAIAAETEVGLLRTVPTSSYHYEYDDNSGTNNAHSTSTTSTGTTTMDQYGHNLPDGTKQHRRRRLHPHYRSRRQQYTSNSNNTNGNPSNEEDDSHHHQEEDQTVLSSNHAPDHKDTLPMTTETTSLSSTTTGIIPAEQHNGTKSVEDEFSQARKRKRSFENING